MGQRRKKDLSPNVFVFIQILKCLHSNVMSESHNCIHKHYKITSAGRTPKYWLAGPPTLTYSIPLATLIYTRSTTLKSSVYFLIDDGGENGKSWPTWYFSDRANLILRNFLRCPMLTSEGHSRYCRWRKHWLQTCKVNNCWTCPLLPAPFSTSRVLMLVFFIDET